MLLQWEKLQRHSEEVRERAETAECQITTISQEYKKLIQERDVSHFSVPCFELCTIDCTRKWVGNAVQNI